MMLDNDTKKENKMGQKQRERENFLRYFPGNGHIIVNCIVQ